MADPEEGNVPIVVVKRRRLSRRHRRSRRIRRWLAVATVALCVAAVASFTLQYLGPSMFRGDAAFQDAQPAHAGFGHSFDQIRLPAEPYADRPVYPYSVVPGGVRDAKELKWYAEHDPVVAAHYAGFDYERARTVRLVLAQTVYVSYRIGNNIYWTRKRITLHKGEKVITDGRMTARARCGNRVEETPQQQGSTPEPSVEKFDEPLPPGTGTAMKSPPVPFQSALLNRPETPGLGPSGPLSLYDPFVGGSWVAISPPPLPSGLCEPIKKKGTGESNSGGDSKKKKKTVCGPGGTDVVPEPGTWVMLASGLAFIWWQARRKLVRA